MGIFPERPLATYSDAYVDLQRKLGVANEPPYFHHGQFTIPRQAVPAHEVEARAAHDAFVALGPSEQDALIEFLKTLRVLPQARSISS